MPGERVLKTISPSPLLRDRDNDNSREENCADKYSGGWWYNSCFDIRLTGEHTRRRSHMDFKQIHYYHGGERGDSIESWKEAEMLLVPK